MKPKCAKCREDVSSSGGNWMFYSERKDKDQRWEHIDCEKGH